MQKDKSALFLVRKIFIGCIPLIAIFGLVLYILIQSKELLTISTIINTQLSNKENSLIGLAYSDPVFYYKNQLSLLTKPKILALGGSRVMQFRDLFFLRKSDFINAGGGVQNIKAFIPFLKKMSPIYKPEILIINLEQTYFNDNFLDNFNTADYQRCISSEPSKMSIIQSSYKKIFSDLRDGKINLNKLYHFKNKSLIGIAAVMNDNGFRSDGSYHYGEIIKSEDRVACKFLKDTFERIEKGNSRFEYGDEVSGSALKDLEELLIYCKENKIYVVGFLPPYAPSVINKLKSKGHKYDYIWKINSNVSPIFKKYSYAWYDFTDLNESDVDVADKEFIDGFHGSEVTYAKIFIKISNDPVLSPFSNQKKLKLLLLNPSNDMEIMKNPL